MTPTTPPPPYTSRSQASPGRASLSPPRLPAAPPTPAFAGRTGEAGLTLSPPGIPGSQTLQPCRPAPVRTRLPALLQAHRSPIRAQRPIRLVSPLAATSVPPLGPRSPKHGQARTEVTSRWDSPPPRGGPGRGAPPPGGRGEKARARSRGAGPLIRGRGVGIRRGPSPQEPHPFPPPRPTLFSATVSLSISPCWSCPSRLSRSPSPRFHPPIPTSPTSAFIPLPSPLLPAPACPTPGKPLPSGSSAYISGFPARGRQRLVGGSSAGAGAASRGPSDRGRSAPATARTALAPALRTAAALRVSAPDPPPPHPARLCRLFQRPSLLSGRRCCCRRRRRHRARFRPRPPSAVQGPSVPPAGPRLPASPGPGTMSEKSVEAAAELSAKDLKEKKEKVEEKASRKERKKEVVEEEENGAEEEEEETAEDGEEEDEAEEEDEEEEEDDDEGPALKRAAEEEDEADPKRQKTENGASA
ncbi:parathymosin [Diceros bicornis minor]|nr:parathymosin [Diceros bicornis minor]